jgi:putative oxidoreductase
VSLVGSLGFPYPAFFAVLSALAESIAALFVALGLYTRWAASIIAINMAVAMYNEVSGGDPFELPATYLLVAVALIITGGGAYSLDHAIRVRRSARPAADSRV